MSNAKKEVAAEVDKLWKEIVSARDKTATPAVLTEEGFKEDPTEIEIQVNEFGVGGEKNTFLGSPSLRQRAINGLKALKAYGPDDNDLETNLSDMVSDLFHLAFQANLDPDEIVRRAHVHFDAEIKGDY
jgi:hypothetical protein